MADIATLGIKVDSRGVVKATSDLDRMERQGQKTERTTRLLKSAFAGLTAALSVREVVGLADAYTSIENRLKTVTESAQELTNVQQQLLNVSNETRSGIGATVDLYTNLARSTETLGVSQGRLIRLTDIINKSFAASGSSAQAAEGAIRQLGQGLAAGALRGDEFNSVAEQAPEILRAVAAETGKTIGELREFAATGGITAELLIRSLENYGETVDRIFSESTATISQAFEIARNNAIQFIGGAEGVQSIAESLAGSIISLSENIDGLVKVGQVAAILFAGRLVGSFTAYTTALAAQTAAALTATTAVSSLNARMGLVPATATAATVATNGLTIAVRGLSGALALLGGPAGLIFIAAAGLLLYAQRAQDAAGATNQFFTEVDRQNKLQELTTKLEEAEKQLDKLRQTAEGFAPDVRAYSGIDENIENTKQKISELRIEINKVETAPLAGEIEELDTAITNLPTGSDKARESLSKLFETLRQQTDTMGLSESQVLAYRLSLGDLSDEVKALGAEGNTLAQSIIRQAEALESATAAEELSQAYKELTSSLSEQRVMIGLTERELFIYEAQARLSENATADMRAEVERLAGALFDEQQAIEKSNLQKEEAKQLLEGLQGPTQIYIAQLEKIKELETAGALTSQEAGKLRLKAVEDLATASRQGLGEITTFAEEASRNIQNLFADNLFDFMQGEFELTGDSFKKMLDRMVAEALAADLAGALFGSASGVAGASGGGLLGSFASSIGSAFGFGGSSSVSSVASGLPSSIPTLSFDGGGYTGSGLRSGGLDGKGGFPALLHPNETIIDHSKGQQMPSNNMTVNVNISGVRDGRDIRESADQAAMKLMAAGQRAMQRNG